MTWSEVEALRGMTQLPILLKGIQTGEDAATAVEVGVDGIWISNHGGRQLDHGRSTLESLMEIANVGAGSATLIVDGGVLTGSDVIKAMALGADLVGLGKLQCLALAAGGEASVLAMLEVLEDEILSQMGLLGVSMLDELNASMVVPSIPAGLPDPADPWSHLR
jgi:L-lactate dehydrogenase (cytochrome)